MKLLFICPTPYHHLREGGRMGGRREMGGWGEWQEGDGGGWGEEWQEGGR